MLMRVVYVSKLEAECTSSFVIAMKASKVLDVSFISAAAYDDRLSWCAGMVTKGYFNSCKKAAGLV